MSLPLGRKNVAVFDEHRNSSRVWPVPPTAVPEALDALARFKASQPDLYGWVASGAPLLTHGHHAAIFGEPYKASRSRKGRSVNRNLLVPPVSFEPQRISWEAAP